MTLALLDQWAARHGVSPLALAELATLFAPAGLGLGGTSEGYTQSGLRVAAPKLGNSLWRNNSGAYLDESGRMVRYGLANDSKRINEVFKSSDLIGITTRLVQPCHIGQTWGLFTAVEVKRPDWTKPENDRDRAQANFHMTVDKMGGIAMFCTSVEQYQARVAQ